MFCRSVAQVLFLLVGAVRDSVVNGALSAALSNTCKIGATCTWRWQQKSCSGFPISERSPHERCHVSNALMISLCPHKVYLSPIWLLQPHCFLFPFDGGPIFCSAQSCKVIDRVALPFFFDPLAYVRSPCHQTSPEARLGHGQRGKGPAQATPSCCTADHRPERPLR